MTDHITIITTTETRDDALTVAKHLVEKRLAACVQITSPITSVYWWKNTLEESTEFQCWIKTQADHFDAIEQAIKEVHPYDLPEIIALPILRGSQDYLSWIDEETRGE